MACSPSVPIVKNFESAISQIVSHATSTPTKRATIVVTGRSGIGKTFLIHEAAQRLHEKCFVVRIDGQDIPLRGLEAVYRGLYDAATSGQRRTAFGMTLLEKYVRLIPGFGSYLEPLVSGFGNSSAELALRRRGLSFGGAPAIAVGNFIAEAAKKMPVFIAVDDIQWLDHESWACVAELTERGYEHGWTLLLTLNTDVVGAHEYLAQIARRSQTRNEVPWKIIEAENWDLDSMLDLCSKMRYAEFKLDSACEQRLFEATDGVPLYVESALHVLEARGDLQRNDDGVYVSAGDWPVIDLESGLHTLLERRLRDTYLQIPMSRKTLEAASVLGDPFSDEDLTELFSLNEAFATLGAVERSHSIVRYLLSLRSWRFSHSRLQKLIYDSLGGQAARLHLEVAKAICQRDVVEPSLVAFHYDRAGDVDSALPWHIKEVERLLGIGLFRSALSVVDTLFEPSEEDALGPAHKRLNEILLLRARALFGLFRFQDSLAQLKRIEQHAKEDHLEAQVQRWLGRCFLKLASQQDFENSVAAIEWAAAKFAQLGEKQQEADCYADLVVANAHLNDFESAEVAFEIAEDLYNRNNDRLGMARLQRRNVIFMESEIAGTIQERLASTFQELGIPHERVMALNNAASVHLTLGNLEKATKLLDMAIIESVDIGDFGGAYLYNNLAIIHVLDRRFELARECVERARILSKRKILDLIIDTTESVLVACDIGVDAALKDMERVMTTAIDVGENAYMEPTVVNVAVCLARMRKFSDALGALLTIKPTQSASKRPHKHRRWYDIAIECFKGLNNFDARNAFEGEFGWTAGKRHGVFETHDFALIDTQFWSD